jgi:hypothetical protein
MVKSDDDIPKLLETAINFSKKIHDDSQKAQSLLRMIKKDTNFENIMLNLNSNSFLEECRTFADIIHDWIAEYPGLMIQFAGLLETISADLNETYNIGHEKISGGINVNYQKKDFRFFFDPNMKKKGSNFSMDEETQLLLDREENKVVQELSELLSLELHIKAFLAAVDDKARSEHIVKTCEQIHATSSTRDPYFVANMQHLINFWKDTVDMLEKIKSQSMRAVVVDEQIAKEITHYFSKEKKASNKIKKIKIAQHVAWFALDVALSIVPFGTVPSLLLSGHQKQKEIRKIATETEEIIAER